MVNIFCHQHGVASSKLKQNAVVTRAKLRINGLHFPVRITHPTRSWMRAELRLDHVEAAQGSSLHGMLDRRTCSNATLLMNLRHIVEKSQWTASTCFWECITRRSQQLPWFCAWLRYTLNELDTSSNGIYTVRNPRADYISTSLRSVVTTTALGFLNRVDPLDSVSNYYLFTVHTTGWMQVRLRSVQ